jgi:hypothetical protein
MGRKPKVTRIKSHTKKIPSLASEILSLKNIKVGAIKPNHNDPDASDREKYYAQDWMHPKMLHFYLGYDLLELQLFVQPFILKKHDISLRLLNVLLYLYPKGYFTILDYFPISHAGYEVRFPIYLVKKGYANVVAKPKDGRNTQKIDKRWVYTLSQKGKEIVREYYELLSGERKFPEKKTPFDKSDKAIDRQRKDLMAKLNQMPVSDNKKKFYED